MTSVKLMFNRDGCQGSSGYKMKQYQWIDNADGTQRKQEQGQSRFWKLKSEMKKHKYIWPVSLIL